MLPSTYRVVLSTPGVSRLLLFGVLARVPHTALGVVLSLHVVEALGRGWAAAGLVGTASTVGMAIGSPWRGRAVDRVGLRRAVLPSVVAAVLVWGAAPFVGYAWLFALCVVGGVLSLPVFTVIRQCLAVMVPPTRHRSAMALDSVSVELSFMAGPALGVVLATQLSSTVALLAVGGAAAVAGVALMVFDPPTRQAAAPGPEPGPEPGPGPVRSATWRRLLGDPVVLGVLAVTAAATIVLAGTDVSILARLREDDALALTGLVFAAWGLGSIVGGLLYGVVRRPVPPPLLLLGLGLLTVPVGLAPSGWWLAVTMLPAAALCAPVITATSEVIARQVPQEIRGEAMGWHGSALMVGSALGAPLAGAAIDQRGGWAGFAAVGVAGAVLAVVGLWVRSPARSSARPAHDPGGRERTRPPGTPAAATSGRPAAAPRADCRSPAPRP